MRLILLPILAPLAFIFSLVSFVRAKLYDAGVLHSESVATKVICVGNLTAGGTGKTPIIRWLALELAKRGKKVCVLSRGYKRSTQAILKVNSSSAEVQKYGDEPLQLSKQLKGIPVYVGADRVKAAQEIIASEQPDVILMDDGFQHRRLKRDLDFVVMDATQPTWHYWPLPLGFGREGSWSLSRASAVLLTKANLATQSEIEKIKVLHARVFQFYSSLVRVRTLDGEIWSLERLRGEKVALLSAIGRPEIFQRQVSDLGLDVVFHKIFPDHHFFRSWEIKAFFKKADARGANRILVTEKDAVKLASMDLPKDRMLIVELEVGLLEGKNSKKDSEGLDALIRKIFS